MKHQEMMLKAKEAGSAEDLMALAKENGMEMSEESAAAYYGVMHESGELADEELNNVAGGWCYNDGRPVITVGEQHDCFVCDYCGNKDIEILFTIYTGNLHNCEKYTGRLEVINNCGNCKYCIYEKGLWLCDNPDNKK